MAEKERAESHISDLIYAEELESAYDIPIVCSNNLWRSSALDQQALVASYHLITRNQKCTGRVAISVCRS